MKTTDTWCLVSIGILCLVSPFTQGMAQGLKPYLAHLCVTDSTNMYVAVPWDCSGYIQCQPRGLGKYHAYWMSCVAGLEFDPIWRICYHATGRCNDMAEIARKYCPFHPQMTFPHRDSCTLYYDCTQRRKRPGLEFYENECKYPMLFDSNENKCKPADKANCDQRNKPLGKCSYRRECGIPSCFWRRDGFYPYPRRPFSVEYVVCNRQKIQKIGRCDAGMAFDPIRGYCTSDFERSIPAYCFTHPDEIFASSRSCGQFYQCNKLWQNEALQPYQKECAYQFLFDDVSMKCQYIGVNCHSRFEPKAPCDYVVGQCFGRQKCLPCDASCLGKEDGPTFYPGKPLTSSYLDCYAERTRNIKQCPFGYVFDPNPDVQRCARQISTETLEWYCGKNPDAIVPHHGECAQYYDCSKKTSSASFPKYVSECEYPMLYDITNNTCKPFREVGCEYRKEARHLCDYLQFKCSGEHCAPCHLSQPHCVDKTDGNWPMPFDAMGSTYIICDTERLVGQGTCPPPQFFSKTTRTCTTKVMKEDLDEFCRLNPRAIFPNPDHCAQYFNCSTYDGKAANAMECVYPEWFSTENSTCKDYKEVNCNGRTEKKDPCDYKILNPCNPADTKCTCPQLSCVNKADGVKTAQSEPSRGFQCLDERTQVLQCAQPLAFFHVVLKKCTASSPTRPHPVVDTAEADSMCKAALPSKPKFPALNNCHQYYDCSITTNGPLGQPYLEECPYPLLYDDASTTCKEPRLVSCIGKRAERVNKCEYSKISCPGGKCGQCNEPKCDILPDGLHTYPSKEAEGRFIRCKTKRLRAVLSCSLGQTFDPETKMCIGMISSVYQDLLCKMNEAKVSSLNSQHPCKQSKSYLPCSKKVNCDPKDPCGSVQAGKCEQKQRCQDSLFFKPMGQQKQPRYGCPRKWHNSNGCLPSGLDEKCGDRKLVWHYRNSKVQNKLCSRQCNRGYAESGIWLLLNQWCPDQKHPKCSKACNQGFPESLSRTSCNRECLDSSSRPLCNWGCPESPSTPSWNRPCPESVNTPSYKRVCPQSTSNQGCPESPSRPSCNGACLKSANRNPNKWPNPTWSISCSKPHTATICQHRQNSCSKLKPNCSVHVYTQPSACKCSMNSWAG